MAKQLSLESVPTLALAEGATTPVPPGVGTQCWSSTTASLMRWDGTMWRSLIPQLSTSLTSQVSASGVATDVAAVTLTIPANALAVGSTFAVDMVGNRDSTAAANTANFWIKVGSTKVATIASPLPASATTLQVWWVTFLVTFRSIGASGSLIVSGYGKVFGATTPDVSMYTSTVTSPIATNGALTLVGGFNFTTGTASNILRCDTANIDQRN